MIGKKLKEYRQSLKLTGATLANLAGINQPYLSQIENEKKVLDEIAKVSPITKENIDEILTEEHYQEFKNLITITKSKLTKEFLRYSPEKNERVYSNKQGYYYRGAILADLGGNWSIYYRDDNFDICFIPKEEDTNSEKVIDEKLRNMFFNSYKANEYNDFITPDNLTVLDKEWYSSIFVYDFDFIRSSLYEWWYNYILQDFSSLKDNELSESEIELLIKLGALQNIDDTFTPINDKDSTNITKELLEGKSVTFDLDLSNEKNVRLLLGGQLLSNSEMDMLKVSLNSIRYSRLQTKIYTLPDRPKGYVRPSERDKASKDS